jgi:hypothetical protein
MKTKITLIILEMPDIAGGVIPTVNTIVSRDGLFPSRYISAGSVEDCLLSLCSEVCNVHCDFLAPRLKALVKASPSVVEAIYCASVQRDIICGRNGYKLKPLESILLEEKYGQCIREIPRLASGR